jgi:hypothetical protein
MAIAGLVRLRKHSFGRQSVFGTKVAATRAYPLAGVPDPDLNWIDPEIDTGSIDITAAPYRGAPSLTATLTTVALNYNDLPLHLAAFFGGGVEPTGGGAAQSWHWSPASTAPIDDPDSFTYEFGDDVVTDQDQYGDGIEESVEFTLPEGLSALTSSMTWRFGSYSNTGGTDNPVDGTVPTPGLAVAVDDAIVFGKDAKLYLADDVAGLATEQIQDALYSCVIRLNHEIDEKRWANGTQTFDANALVPGARTIEWELTLAPTDDIVGVGSESDDWMSDQAVNRYGRLVFTSTVLAQSPSTFYSWEIKGPLRYYTRTYGDIGGNTTRVLTGRMFYDPDDFGGIVDTTVVNTLTAAELGLAGS